MGHVRLFAAAESGGALPRVDTQYKECFLCGSNDVTVRGPDDAMQLEFATSARTEVNGGERPIAVRIVDCHDCGAIYTVDTSA